MADGAATPAGTLHSLPPRAFAAPWLTVGALAAGAWLAVVAVARSMGNQSGTMGLSLAAFLVLWVVMMAAMMLPSVTPVAVLWARLITGGATGFRRVLRLTSFLLGYLLTWAAAGVVVFAALTASGQLLTASPQAQRWLGAGILAAAGAYQLSPWKEWCLARCRSPIGTLMFYLGFSGRGRDLRVGVHHGATCAGCCSGLMIVLVAVGVMNVAVMAGLAGIIFVEKLWRHGRPFGRAVGVVLVAVGVLSLWLPWLLPDVPPAMPMM